MTNAFARRLSAEAVGAMILTLFGGAAVIAASLSGFAANLLGPLAFGFALLTGIHILGPISGAHFNPAVTVALAVRGRFPWGDVIGYVVAQCVGAIVAGLLLFFTFGNTGVKAGLATTHYPSDVHGKYVLAVLLAEALGTFLLAFTVIAVTDPERTGTVPAALAIGLALATAALAFGAVSSGSFNFARTIGPEIINALAGGKSAWGQMWVYLVGPIAGGVVAAYAHKGLTSTCTATPAPATPATAAPKQKARR
jgi:glycerol uptake facilitator protein